MQSRRLKLALALCACAALFAAAGAAAALVEVEGLVLHADGGFQPHVLPRHRFVPINFQGHVDLRAKGGGPPPALQQAIVDFDRDGRLSAGGLPSCAPEQVAAASPAEARRICAGAIVGTGHVEALVSLPSGAVKTSSPLTFFNGPREAGHPTVIVHAQTTVPVTQTYAILVPIQRRRGNFRYRVTFNVPPLAEGLAAITHVDLNIGRRFSVNGSRRSYVSAHCSDGVLETHGRFTFADGTVIDGSVQKPCTPK